MCGLSGGLQLPCIHPFSLAAVLLLPLRVSSRHDKLRDSGNQRPAARRGGARSGGAAERRSIRHVVAFTRERAASVVGRSGEEQPRLYAAL